MADRMAETECAAAEGQLARGKATKQAGIVVAAAVGLVLLAAAGFVAGRLATRSFPSTDGATALVALGNGVSYRAQILPAKELPETDPDVGGVCVGREDQRIFVGTGDASITAVRTGIGDERRLSVSHDGPVAEVVVTHDTAVYKDATKFPETAPSGTVVVQQSVEQGSAEEIGEYTMVSVWGERSGDRVTARVLVYRLLPGQR